MVGSSSTRVTATTVTGGLSRHVLDDQNTVSGHFTLTVCPVDELILVLSSGSLFPIHRPDSTTLFGGLDRRSQYRHELVGLTNQDAKICADDE